MTDKGQMLRDLDEAWDDLQTVLGSLDEIEMQQPGITGDWSVRDLLGHIAFWAQKSADDIRLLAEGREAEIETPPNERELDAWNAREAAARGKFTAAEASAECKRSHEATRSALEAAAPERLDVEVKGWTMAHRFAEDTNRHYHEHAEQIRAWQRQLETTEA